ncbi:MAG: site-specific DNA-methyltransferase [Treponema sp.]|uniref:site-specific DNA-methyltransferase n=1 Tax=Treponema sp. TaxID=166 RepID=UPI0025F49241|nr:site-specific DNA-methyltransferase [Treponema sp.]MBQ9282176.1 site-specific DNA-methyltransferase [Treponema sp.]
MSTNISKQKREDLLYKIEEIRKYLKNNLYDENVRNLMGYLNELTTQINGQKYGLVFEEHREKIDETLENNLSVLTEEKDLFVGNGGEMNFLLEGDNLASLQLLEKTHKGKIDVIYIDPPYNTGNKDFIYDDDFVDSADSFRHSKWLSFMEKRLRIARELLSEKGVIFISIDDNEQATIKILCDEIFGENNFVGNYIWRKKYGGGQAVDYFSTEHEYICVYRKSEQMFWLDETVERSSKEFNHSDSNGIFKTTKLAKWGNTSRREDRPTMYFPIKAPDNSDCFPIAPDGNDGRWRIGKEKMKILEQNKLIHWEQKENKWIPYEKEYFSGQTKTIKDRSIIYDVAETGDGSNVLTEIFNTKDKFLNPKPVEIIVKLLKNVSYKSKPFTILDFFAGSGTTGHAVLKLNAEDGGKRKFILCTNNENGICRDITYERLKTVITGERKDGSKYSDGLSGSLKYFKVDFVEITEKEYYEYADKLLLHVRELVELENAVDFEHNKAIAIVLTEEELEEFMQSLASTPLSNQVETEDSERSRTVYVGHDVLLSKAQKELLKQKEISVKIIPQYYYPELNG